MSQLVVALTCHMTSLLRTIVQQHKDTCLINNKLCDSSAGARTLIARLICQILVDYGPRGHSPEQSKPMEADTCQSEALLRPDFIQDILLLPGEIIGPVASQLWEAVCTDPSKSSLLYTLGVDPGLS